MRQSQKNECIFFCSKTKPTKLTKSAVKHPRLHQLLHQFLKKPRLRVSPESDPKLMMYNNLCTKSISKYGNFSIIQKSLQIYCIDLYRSFSNQSAGLGAVFVYIKKIHSHWAARAKFGFPFQNLALQWFRGDLGTALRMDEAGILQFFGGGGCKNMWLAALYVQ